MFTLLMNRYSDINEITRMTGNDFDNIICGGEEVYLQSQGSQILLRGWTSAKHQGLFVVLQTKAIRRFAKVIRDGWFG